ncbi:hypothetical protein [Halorubrum ezzemoulense]|uniref:hypothetical protein n=1 Tax=Halorubrum ezzemoulense TaxID=337243 RepID=UPI00111C81B6|nr:hypothetical protein [Halorubrum ezzemoulense]
MDEGKGERREADKAKTIRDMIVDGTLSERRGGQGMRGDEQGPTTGDGTPPTSTATGDNRPLETTTEPDEADRRSIHRERGPDGRRRTTS